LAINGQWISAPEDDRFNFVIQVATGGIPELDKIAAQLHTWSHQEG
jgi:death-on-curing protein